MSPRNLLAGYTLCIALVASGCGGGGSGSGSGSDGNGNGPSIPAELTAIAVETSNGRQFAVATYHLMHFRNQATTGLGYAPDIRSNNSQKAVVPTLHPLLWKSANSRTETDGAHSQAVVIGNHCLSGSVDASGSLLTQPTGTVHIVFDNCVDQQSGALIDGTLDITINQYNSAQQPVGATYRATNLRQRLMSANIDTVTNAVLTLTPAANASASVELDAHIRDDVTGSEFWAQDLRGTRLALTSGEIAHSKFGRLRVDSLTDWQASLGATQSKLNISFSNSMLVIMLDSDADNLFEWQARLQDLPANADFVYPATAPVLSTPSNMAIDRNTASALADISVVDSDGDFVKIEIPAVTGLTIEHTDWDQFSATGSTAGNYVVAVHAVDQYGRRSSSAIDLRVRLDRPTIITDIPNETTTGAALSIDLLPANADQGPFEYTIVSAPPGATLSPDGKLHWIANLPIYWPQADIHFSTRVSNEDHAVDHNFAITLHDPNTSMPSIFTGNKRNPDAISFSLDDNDKLSVYLPATDNFAAIFKESNNSLERTLHMIPRGEPLLYVTPAKNTAAGGAVVSMTTHQVIVTSSDFSRTLSSRSFADLGIDYYSKPLILDTDNDGKEELLIGIDSLRDSIGITTSTRYYSLGKIAAFSLPDLEPLWQVSEASIGTIAIGNLDHDSNQELAATSGQIIDLASGQIQWRNQEFSDIADQVESIFLWDLDGNGVLELVATYSTLGAQIYAVWDTNARRHWRNGVYIAPSEAPADCRIFLAIGSKLKLPCYGLLPQVHSFHYAADSDQIVFDETVALDLPTTKDEVVRVSNSKFVAISRPTPDEFHAMTFDLESGQTGPLMLISDFRHTNFSGGLNHRDQLGAGPLYFVEDFGFRLLKMSAETESPLALTAYKMTKPMTVFDADLDGQDEIYFSANNKDSAQDFSATTLWEESHEADPNPRQIIAATNSDGTRNPLIANASTLFLRNSGDGSILWNAPIGAYSIAQVHGSDAIDFVTTNGNSLTTLKSGPGTFQIISSTTPMTANVRNLITADVTGDQKDEIFAAFSASEQQPASICSFDADDLDRRFCIQIGAASGALQLVKTPEVAYLIASIAVDTGYTNEIHTSRLIFIDATSGSLLWQSPVFAGHVASDGIHIVENGHERPTISIATDQAIYLAH